MDLILLLALATSFGLFLATHVALCAGLVRRDSAPRALLAFLAPPLAMVWGFRAGMRGRSVLGASALAVHFLCWIASTIGHPSPLN